MTDVENSTGKNNQTAADDAVKQPAKIDAKKTTKAAAKEKQPSKGGAGLLWLFVLITLAVSGAALWGVYTLSQKSETNAVSQGDLLEQSQTAIIDLRGDIGGLDSKISDSAQQQMAALDGTKNKLGLLSKTVDKQARHIKELSASNRDQWLISEVEYLLRLANQSILMSKDSGSALAMLESADTVLQDIDDVALHNVRKAMADDMASLRTLEQLDIDGMYLELSALASSLEGLELYEIPEFGLGEIETETMKDEEAAWQERVKAGFSAIGTALEKAFVVRRDGESVEAMLPPQEELYLRQNLRLMLEQAQLALLSRKPEVYRNSLEKAQKWLAQYFLTDKNGTQQVLQSIGKLATVNVDPPLPDISGSFRALKKYQQNQMNARPGLEGYEAQPATNDIDEDTQKNSKAPAVDDIAVEDKEPSADQKPSASVEPSIEKDVPASKTPSENTAPSSAENPAASKEPVSDKGALADQKANANAEQAVIEPVDAKKETLLDKVKPMIDKIIPGGDKDIENAAESATENAAEKASNVPAVLNDQSAQTGV